VLEDGGLYRRHPGTASDPSKMPQPVFRDNRIMTAWLPDLHDRIVTDMNHS
jgi:hypothetical protein